MSEPIARRKATDAELAELEQQLGVSLPSDYRSFLQTANGFEGRIGHSGYIALWSCQQIIGKNGNYKVAEFASGFLLFGSDGGGEAFAFDMQNAWAVVMIPFVGMARTDAIPVGNSFTEFMRHYAADLFAGRKR